MGNSLSFLMRYTDYHISRSIDGRCNEPYGDQSFRVEYGEGDFNGKPEGPMWALFCETCHKFAARPLLNGLHTDLCNSVVERDASDK